MKVESVKVIMGRFFSGAQKEWPKSLVKSRQQSAYHCFKKAI
jgi:hypothetical protein